MLAALLRNSIFALSKVAALFRPSACPKCTLLGLRGAWPQNDGMSAEELTWMKDSWHRAYYSRQLAEKMTGSRREAILMYAEEARKKYRELASPRLDYHRSIAVLDALFATLDGDRGKALDAAKRVEVERNDDVEDLYPAAIAFDLQAIALPRNESESGSEVPSRTWPFPSS
jgi:hypothetical protein